MQEKRRIGISIHGLDRAKLCDIYNSNVRTEGQAYDVVIRKEENGWKELSFNIPTKLLENNVLVDNFRLEYLKNEYLVRVQLEDYIDWYYLNEPKVSHKNKTLSLEVVCGHISSILRTKNLYLELNDDNGIGTAKQLANTILQRTGWSLGLCDTFYEKDGVTEKIRTLKASSKTGSYQMISNLCSLFKARPTYHGESKTVEIHVFNPLTGSSNPDLTFVEDAGKVFELNYGKALTGITRKLDTGA
ncbi:MAG: hypothetical protein GX763_05870 [Clostridiaceae bacterium]|nr:hypothetical protein [Clostridiaceae bacterium]